MIPNLSLARSLRTRLAAYTARLTLAAVTAPAALSLGLLGCTQQTEPEAAPALARTAPVCDCATAAPLVDTTLLAFLSKARALHHEADMAEGRNDPAAAVVALDRLTAARAPANRPEVDEVLADTRARLADLRAGRGDFDGAARDVVEGLRTASGDSYFRGHLFEVSGLVEERRARALDASGDRAGAAQARKRALEASDQAVRIQEEVIRRALDGRDREAP
jgi:hypothetical protein